MLMFARVVFVVDCELFCGSFVAMDACHLRTAAPESGVRRGICIILQTFSAVVP